MGYLSETYEVNADNPADIDVKGAIGKPAVIGYITADDGDITVRINSKGGAPIPVFHGEQIVFEREDKWKIKRAIIETESPVTLTVRVLLKS